MDAEQPTLTGLISPPVIDPVRPRRDFSVKDLSAWAHRQVGWIARKSGLARQSDLFVYAQAAKLVEEVGELHAELLGRSKMQRKGKSHEFSSAGLEGELADVVICATILADILDVDLAAALQRKMHVVDERVVVDGLRSVG